MIDRFDNALCACCARAAIGIGYTPSHTKPIIWLCDDPECIQTAQRTYSMKQDDFTRQESLAAGKGGEQGGEFLDSIGKTDLASLNEGEWFEFCRRIISGYRKGLAEALKNEAPF